jgi:hypothetical protein
MRALLLSMLALAFAASPAEAALTFRHADGTVVPITGKVHVWCGKWQFSVPTVNIFVRQAKPERTWQFFARLKDIGPGVRQRFPHDLVSSNPRGAELFTASDGNEASTAEQDASGSMTFTKVSCERGKTLAFRVDAWLGSEFSNGPREQITGTFSGTIGKRPF